MHMLIHFLMLTRFSDRTYADPLPLIINMLTRFTDRLFIISDSLVVLVLSSLGARATTSALAPPAPYKGPSCLLFSSSFLFSSPCFFLLYYEPPR